MFAVEQVTHVRSYQCSPDCNGMGRSFRSDGFGGCRTRPDRNRATGGTSRDVSGVLADVDPGAAPIHDLRNFAFRLRLRAKRLLTRLPHLPGRERHTENSRTLERRRGGILALPVTDAGHKLGQAQHRVAVTPMHGGPRLTPTFREFAQSVVPRQVRPVSLSRQGRRSVGVATQGSSRKSEINALSRGDVQDEQHARRRVRPRGCRRGLSAIASRSGTIRKCGRRRPKGQDRHGKSIPDTGRKI